MLEKEWYCEICNTGINYTLAGKHCHMKTKKHIKKQTKIIILIRSDLEKHETRNMSDKNRRFGASCAIIKVT